MESESDGIVRQFSGARMGTDAMGVLLMNEDGMR
jgi:hypothetical protein